MKLLQRKTKAIALFLLVAILVTGCFGAMNAMAGPLPDTGQAKCYNNEGEISHPAPDEDFYRQNASYTISIMPYTKLDDSGNDLADNATSWTMVRDNVNGLIWENKQDLDGTQDYTNPHDADNTCTWYDPNPATNGGYAGTPGDGTDTNDFIENLNGDQFGGYSDWRLPDIVELRSLVDESISAPNPTINAAYFPSSQPAWYWTRITDATMRYGAWVVDFYNGADNRAYKYDSLCVRAVRGGEYGSLGHPVILAPEQASVWDIGTIMPILWNINGIGANVTISLSRQGGKDDSFETIIPITPNDGEKNWIVTGTASKNCFIKIEQADNPANWAAEGLFVIQNTVSSVFYEQYYLARHSDVAKAVHKGLFGTGWEHFLTYGKDEGRIYDQPDNYGGFNETYYLARYPDVAKAVHDGLFGTGWEHFLQYGQNEGRSYDQPDNYGDFNEAFYLARYADVAKAVHEGFFGTGWEHFLTYGKDEGRIYDQPETYGDFNEAYYLAQYADVAKSVAKGYFGTGWDHYQQWGQNEGRNYNQPDNYEEVAYGGLLPGDGI